MLSQLTTAAVGTGRVDKAVKERVLSVFTYQMLTSACCLSLHAVFSILRKQKSRIYLYIIEDCYP